ncbi:hypothetical protein [Streptomyces sp. NPDC102360]|uniref:hypothetical protein n=1 Tax=Streptomyces sp. NPDC102360 TaxID=3366160 RepID=UPI00382D6B9E
MVVGTQLGHREAVLALAHQVSVGQRLTVRDLREVNIASDDSLGTIKARFRSSVLGRPLASGLPEGALLTENALGKARVPAPGEAVAAVGMKEGRFPPGLQAGSRVAVVVSPGDAEGTVADESAVPSPSSKSWSATVTEVEARANEQTTVISLLMHDTAAKGIAAVPEGRVSLVVVRGGER